MSSYATTDELFRVLKVRNATQDQIDAAQGDLDTATFEINQELDRPADAPQLTAEETALCHGVCIDRAADIWRHRESAAGILGVVDELPVSTFGRYSFQRYADRLSRISNQRYGLA